MSRPWALGALVVLAGLLIVPAVAFACSNQSTIIDRPSSGLAGATSTVNGSAWNDAGGDIQIHWNDANGPVLATTRGATFSVPVTIPAATAPGVYTLVAVQLTNSAAAPFQVLRAGEGTTTGTGGGTMGDGSSDGSSSFAVGGGDNPPAIVLPHASPPVLRPPDAASQPMGNSVGSASPASGGSAVAGASAVAQSGASVVPVRPGLASPPPAAAAAPGPVTASDETVLGDIWSGFSPRYRAAPEPARWGSRPGDDNLIVALAAGGLLGAGVLVLFGCLFTLSDRRRVLAVGVAEGPGRGMRRTAP